MAASDHRFRSSIDYVLPWAWKISLMLPKVVEITMETRYQIVRSTDRILPESILPAIEMLRHGLDQQAIE